LSKAVYPEGEEIFEYDNAGNRIKRIMKDVTVKYSYDRRNRLIEKIEGGMQTSYRYDPQGNLIEEEGRRGTTRYTYDCFNRTESVRTAEGGYIRNRYDPEGLRYELYENGKVSRFIFSGREVVTEVDDNYGLKAAIIRGHEILAQKDSKDSSYYYFNNAHGDVTALLDGRGEIVNRYKYDAFGNTVEAVEKVHNRFRYAGEQFDPVTGQYYLRARFYNPVIGRFTQEDTYRGDGLNLYAYVQNNPVKYVDPSGYSSACSGKSNMFEENFNEDEYLISKTYKMYERLQKCWSKDNPKKSTISKNELGPAIAGIYDTKTGKIFFAINDPLGRTPETSSIGIHPIIKDRIDNMPEDIKKGYTRTLAAGSHAEVFALNKALQRRPDAQLSEFKGFVLTNYKLSKDISGGSPFERCDHCAYITKGVKFLSDDFD